MPDGQDVLPEAHSSAPSKAQRELLLDINGLAPSDEAIATALAQHAYAANTERALLAQPGSVAAFVNAMGEHSRRQRPCGVTCPALPLCIRRGACLIHATTNSCGWR